MPLYDYACSSCSHTFTEFLSIGNRHQPTEQACPQCGTTGTIYQSIGAPPIGDAVRLGIRKIDGGFKEVLQRIHAANPRSNLNNKW
jgi:putative FmdB family regulatory protein